MDLYKQPEQQREERILNSIKNKKKHYLSKCLQIIIYTFVIGLFVIIAIILHVAMKK